MSLSKVASVLAPEKSGSKSPDQVKLRQTCDACQAIKTRCSRDQPACQRCRTQNIQCQYSVSRRIGRPRRQAQPPSPASPSHVRRQENVPVSSEPSNEIASASQSSSGVCTVDWSVIDIDVDSDRMRTDGSESLSNRSNDAVEQRSRIEDNRSRTPRVGQAHIGTPIPRDLGPGTSDQNRFINSFLGLSGSSFSSSLNSEIEGVSNHNHNHTAQPSLDESIYSFGQQLEYSAFDISPSEHEFDASGTAGWDISTNFMSPTRDGACQCLESALSVTISIERQGHAFPNPETMDLALDVEAQLREVVPLVVHCSVCKVRQGEILNMFSNAMASVVDLFQKLCNVELFGNSESPNSKRRASSMMESVEWFQPKSGERASIPNPQQFISHDRSISRSTTQAVATSNRGGTYGSANGTDPKSANPKLGGWPVLVGRHQIVGDDRKCILMHLLRRRLCALSNVLEGLIRAMQDLRMTLKRVNSFNSCDDDESKRVAEIDTRKPVKTASKLYDIIDQLENIQI
ncbi:hypothetical protein DL98DRAFT_591456 [Cadophora sp. DSE1049]|nr:hypothetical protein DL98DRAFT_591456 [Cadophora sp. DSE1049]